MKSRFGRKYRTYTWEEYERIAGEIAAGLRVLGIGKGDIVALDSSSRAEFYLADIGIMANGSTAAALYDSYPPPHLVDTLRACDAKAVFVEDPETLKKLQAAGASDLPVRWILLTGSADGALTLEELRAEGRRAMAHDPGYLARIIAQVSPCDHAILYLTSGATGEPKMALVTHAALVANMDMGPDVLDMGTRDSTLAFLPSAHITQRIVIELLPIRCAIPVWFSAGLTKLSQELQSIKPTLFVAPPRLWEKIYSTIRGEVRKRPALLQRTFHVALGLGLKAAELREQGRPVPKWMHAPLKAADRFVFRKLRARFGGHMRVCASGSAPLGQDLALFYRAFGLPLIEGFGLTEGGVVMMNPLDRPKAGSIGKPLPGVEVRLADDGELLVKSPTLFTGYFRDPEATAQVLRGGWLYTGDTADIDAEGYIYITGRKKELIVSSNGKKIFPSRIECLFKMEPIVTNILLIGDHLPYVTALFTVNTTEAESLEGMEAWKGKDPAEIAKAAPVMAAVRQAVARVNQKLADFEQIRKFRILDRDFSIERGELTPTLKVRRSRALKNFRADVNVLYAGKENGSTQ